jgi:hypothetical protein
MAARQKITTNMVDDVTQMAEAWWTNYKAYHKK